VEEAKTQGEHVTTTDIENAEQIAQWRRRMRDAEAKYYWIEALPRPTRWRWLVPVLLAPFALIAVGVILCVACLMLVVFAVVGPAFLIGKLFRAVR
jgi:hypothetical protein